MTPPNPTAEDDPISVERRRLRTLTPAGTRAVAAAVADWARPGDVVVLELSSFQLWWTRRIQRSPHVTLVTNLFPEHLDRHGRLEHYARAKRAALDFQTPDDVAVLPADDAAVREADWLTAGQGRRLLWGTGGDVVVDGDEVIGPFGRASLAGLV